MNKIRNILALFLILSLCLGIFPLPSLGAGNILRAEDGLTDDTSPAFSWTGDWVTQAIPDRFGGTYRCGPAGACAEITFEGSGIQFITTKHGGAGAFSLELDGTPVATATTYSEETLNRTPAYSIRGLSQGIHVLRITCIGWVEVDGAQVLTREPPQGQSVRILSQPRDLSVPLGEAAVFSLSAEVTGGEARYQWQRAAGDLWENLGTAPSLVTEPMTREMDGSRYRCAVISAGPENAVLSFSQPVTLTLSAEKTEAFPPLLVKAPEDASVPAPLRALFSVKAASPDGGTLTYHWQLLKDEVWEDIPGAEERTFLTPPTAEAMNGTRYRCRITNSIPGLPSGALVSPEAQLQVTSSAGQKISLNRETGLLDIDYAGYLSQHDVVFQTPALSGPDGSTVGTGRLGAMVWNRDGYKLEITNVDGAPYSSIPSGLVTYTSSPMPRAVPGAFRQRLHLYEGTLTTDYGDGLFFTVMGRPKGEVMGIHVVDTRTNVTSVSVDLSLWLDKLDAFHTAPFEDRPFGNTAIAMPNEETWLNPQFTVNDSFVAITRGAEDPNHFGLTIALTVDGAKYRASEAREGTLRLDIDPEAREYTIWIANPSRRSAPNHDTLAVAEAMLREVRGSYGAEYERFTAFWKDFWSRSFVRFQCPGNSDADYFENSWYVYQYLLACGSYGEFPFHFMNGVWRGDEQDEAMWSWDYTSYNERNFAYAFYAANHLEQADSYYNLFFRNMESGRRYTHSRFWEHDRDPRFDPDRPGYLPGSILSPERHTWNGEMQVGYLGTDTGCPYTTSVNATAAEHALGTYEKYKYTGDEAYLREKAYPFIRAVGIYLLNFLQYDEASGTYYSADSNAMETYWKVQNPINDLAAFPALLECAIEAAAHLGEDPQLQALWQDRLEHMAPPKTEPASAQAAGITGSDLRYLPHDPPAVAPSNHQNPQSDVIWPYNRVGLHQEGRSGFAFGTAYSSFLDRQYVPICIWNPDAIVTARLGLGDDSFRIATDMIALSQRRPSGMHYDPAGGAFESNALVLTALGEELLQSYNDKIAVFPAVPSDPAFQSAFTLLARGGFLVTSEYEKNAVKYISLVSQLGGPVTVINPWTPGTEIRVTDLTTGRTLLTGEAEELSFLTEKDGKYLLEAQARPLSAFGGSLTLTGTPNEGAKYLSRGGRVLGTRAPELRPLTAEEGMVDDTRNAFLWEGTWETQSISDRFGGTFRQGAPGAAAEILFEGQGIQFLTTRHGGAGAFRLLLDGEPLGQGTAHSGALAAQAPGYTVWGLPQGLHTLRIECIGYAEVDGAQVLTENPLENQAITVTAQPRDQVISSRGAASFTLEAGVPEGGLTFQWQKQEGSGWKNIPGATGRALTLTGLSPRDAGTRFRCRLSCVTEKGAVFAVSEAAVLTAPVENPFADVRPSDWFCEPVLWAVEHHITAGLTPTRFGPEGFCTRAQAVTFLWRAAGSPAPADRTKDPFTDLNRQEYYMDAILWAVEQGITSGVTSTRFAPDRTCTRAQIVTFLWRAAGTPAPQASEHRFTDLNEQEYYMAPVLWAVEQGITQGITDTAFAPHHTCTRGQIVTFLYRARSEA